MSVPRTLVSFDTADLPQRVTDVLVLGSGVAGLSAALAAAAAGAKVLVATKGEVRASNTFHAQGGIAVALAPGDRPRLHAADTLATGCGLGDPRVIRFVVERGAKDVRALIAAGARFDKTGDRLDFAREGGHQRSRVLHANGDATGRAIEEALLARVAGEAGITLLEHAFAIDLLVRENRCLGALVFDIRLGRQVVWASRIVLATGGCGRLWRETTNPEVATGDGLAMALRAGLPLVDCEFMQFHPTTLYVAGSSRSLISEALRGEGAVLRDAAGIRFMPDFHPDAELAPRDVVSRAIWRVMAQTGQTHVSLDLSHLPARAIRRRFPGIDAVCREFDIDIARDPIPVRPAAHYMVGGVPVDLKARTHLASLFACGEVAATGLHGANRLASNSLLEGLVFGGVAGHEAGREARRNPPRPARISVRRRIGHRGPIDVADAENSLRSLMWREVGVERSAAGLAEARSLLRSWSGFVLDREFDFPGGWQVQNEVILARAVVEAAERRRESRGVHYRTDFPLTDDRRFRRHIEVRPLP